jgi:hypothetical protein
VAPHEENEDSYYSEYNDEDGKELKEAYKTLYVEFEKLRKTRKQHIHKLNSLQTEKSFAAAQNTRSRGEATGNITSVGEGHWWEANPYAVNLEEPNRYDWTRVCSSSL